MCKDNGPENVSPLRRLAVNALKRDTTGKLGIKYKDFKASFDDTYRLRLLQLILN